MDIQGRRDLLKRGKGMAGTMGRWVAMGTAGGSLKLAAKTKILGLLVGMRFWEPGFGSRDWELDRPDSLRLRGG